ncbi:MAG TPA: ABC transporter permease [archaeon]|nr:ABC transporter permease [archaeon]
MHIVMQFFHELKKEKMRMFLTIIAICWGSANVVLMLSVGEGLHRQLGKGMRGMGQNIVVVWSGQTSKPFAGFGTGREMSLLEDDIETIRRNVPEIAQISPEYARWDNVLKVDGRTYSALYRAVYPCYQEMRNLVPEPGGRFINALDMEKNRRVIFLGNTARDKLFPDGEQAVGKTIMVNDIPFTVIGVLKKKLQISCYFGNDEYAAFIPSSTFRMIYGREQGMSNMIFLPRTPEETDKAKENFYQTMAAKYRFDPQDKNTYSMWDTHETGKIQDIITRGIQIFIGFIGCLTLLIGGIGVANIMYVVIKERTREIGIKMAVGAKQRYIIGQFVTESLLTVAIGGLLGIGLVAGLVKGIQMVPIKNEAMDLLGKPVFSALLALVCTTILGFIGLMAGIFPARRASSIDPVEALRYE